MKLRHILLSATAVLALAATSASALTFNFVEEVGGVRMIASGSIDTAGLVRRTGVDGWGGQGIEENSRHDIMGDTTLNGPVDVSFGFNAGTDFSQWASANGPWAASNFSWSTVNGTKSFTTYIFGSGQIPGLGIREADLVGTVWSSDAEWFQAGASFASLSMFTGTYTVSDAVSGESISFVIGDAMPAVPLPAGGMLLLSGLAALGVARRKARS